VLRGADLGHLPLATLIVAGGAPNSPDDIDDAGEPTEPDVSPEEVLAEVHRSGFDEGVAAAEAAMRSSLESAIAALDAAARDLTHARQAWEETGPLDTVGVALEIAEIILMREVATAADPGREAIARCLTEMTSRETATIRLHPDDMSQLGSLDDLLADRNFDLVSDPTVASGDAVADTPTGSIDARLRGALGRVREELLR